eukprot:CAMPEP_0116929600 /NCGR_PEP_ID=MMETSP0467-20121206/26676_1 /TAXON_ID=283647 /ORGANISM="Mesodinium pulex, Strain SPMC105" /LENGTH=235 /DNA_ID=CAMNT_0004609597 /DNA_START=47 /DNA_END=754 /DNA_ORIENTATION=+
MINDQFSLIQKLIALEFDSPWTLVIVSELHKLKLVFEFDAFVIGEVVHGLRLVDVETDFIGQFSVLHQFVPELLVLELKKVLYDVDDQTKIEELESCAVDLREQFIDAAALLALLQQLLQFECVGGHLLGRFGLGVEHHLLDLRLQLRQLPLLHQIHDFVEDRRMRMPLVVFVVLLALVEFHFRVQALELQFVDLVLLDVVVVPFEEVQVETFVFNLLEVVLLDGEELGEETRVA